MLLNARLDSLALWYRQNTRTVVAAATAALIAAAGMYVVQEMRLRDHRIAVNEHQDRMRAVLTAPDATLRTAGLHGGGTITLISSRRDDSAVVVLTVKDAEPVELDETYQVWLIEGSNSRSIGLLEPEQTSATFVVNGLRGALQVGVTVEQAAGARSPTLPLIAEIAFPR